MVDTATIVKQSSSTHPTSYSVSPPPSIKEALVRYEGGVDSALNDHDAIEKYKIIIQDCDLAPPVSDRNKSQFVLVASTV